MLTHWGYGKSDRGAEGLLGHGTSTCGSIGQVASSNGRYSLPLQGDVQEAKNILESYIQAYPDCVHTPTISMRIKRLKLESRAALNRLSQPGDDGRT